MYHLKIRFLPATGHFHIPDSRERLSAAISWEWHFRKRIRAGFFSFQLRTKGYIVMARNSQNLICEVFQLMDVCLKTKGIWGAWVARSVKHPTLGFGSGHDLMVHEFDPHGGLHADTMEPAWNSLSLSLSLSPSLCSSPALSFSLSLKINENSLKK